VRLLNLALGARSGLPALLLVLLAVALIGSVQFHLLPCAGELGGCGPAGLEPGQRGLPFLTPATIAWTTMVESQQRLDRRCVVEEMTQESTALGDKNGRTWMCQRQRCASWVTTLTTAADPCTVLCTFLV